MAKYLAVFTHEVESIEINGFVVMSNKEVENYEQLAESITWPITYELGDFTLNYSDGEELLSRIEFKELNPEEVKTYKRNFNNEFGVFIPESFLYTQIDDEDDDEDGEDNDDEDINSYY